MKKLHSVMKKDKSLSRHQAVRKKHIKLEKEYEKLKSEVKALRSRKAVRKHHIRKVYMKAHKLHQRAIKDDHPILKKSLSDIKSGLASFGSWIGAEARKGSEYLKQRIAEEKEKSAHKEENLMKAKIEAGRADVKKREEEEKAKLMD